MQSDEAVQGYLLTPQQQAVWRLRQQGRPPLHVSCLVRIAGDPDRERLAAAVRAVVARHESLRTTFRQMPGMKYPIQVVTAGAPATFVEEAIEASDVPQWLDRERAWYADLATGPLFRATLLRSADAASYLALRLSALCGDLRALQIVVREIGELYATGVASPDDPLQLAEYGEWLREVLEQEDAAEGRAFWASRTAGLDPPAFPFESGPRHRDDASREMVTRPLSAALAVRLRDVASIVGAEPDAFWLTCWHTLLWRWQPDAALAIRSTLSGRRYDEMQAAVAPIGRALPISCAFGGHDRFRDRLEQVRDALRDAARWLEYYAPADDGSPERGFAGFEMIDASSASTQSPGTGSLVCEIVDQRGIVEDATLQLCVHVGAPDRLSLHYDASVLTAADAARLLAQLERLAAAAVLAPEAEVASLDLLGDDERRQILLEWNATDADLPLRRVDQLVAEQARWTPEAVAVASGDQLLTYRDLEARSNQFTWHLRCQGVTLGSLVGLALPGSPDLLVALLGIMKSGGAYVPLDPQDPAARLDYMLADADAVLVVTTEALRPTVARSGKRVVSIDTDWRTTAAWPTVPPPTSAGPDDLAYVMYTSGSTGKPKGTLVTHRGLTNYLTWCIDAYAVADGQGAPAYSPITFDLSVTSLLAPLLCGRTVKTVAASSGVDALVEALASNDPFSFVKLTPAHLGPLTEHLPAAAGQASIAIIGGETLSAEALRGWRACRPALRVVNEYGPTETVVGCCTYEVPAGGLESGAVPIGRPIANTQLYVLDRQLEPVPVGMAGELCVGGYGVARGYHRRPGLTAGAFVPSPFAAQPGARMYRTGDLARYRADGTLECLGRIDQQVKVRGHRLELGEIETVLRQQDGVREVAVLARRDAPGDVRLVAYVVIDPRQTSVAALRTVAEAQLPDYMVPALFIEMSALPLARSGKVDRKALPAPGGTRPSLEQAFVPPRALTEEVLASIWAEVLGLDRVGIHDNFFALGGDSIRSIQARARAVARGLSLTNAQMFEHQTIAALARVIGYAGEEAREQTLEPFALIAAADRETLPDDLEDAYPLAALQSGMVFHTELAPASAVYHDIHSFRLRTRIDEPALRRVLAELMRRHPVLRTSFELSRYSRPLQLVHASVATPLTVIDLRDRDPEARERALDAWHNTERVRGFSWREPPLLHFWAHLLDEDELQFSLSFHHAILDGWSAASLLTELFNRYHELTTTPDVPAPPPIAASYRDFVALERDTIQASEAQAFWSRQLSGFSVGRLARRDAPPAEPRERIGMETVTLAADVSNEVRRLARAWGLPLKSVLLAVHLKVMSVHTGQLDVLTGVVSNGRGEGPDGDRVLGLFLNTVPFRLQLQRATWSELARATFEAERGMLPFRRYPLSELQNQHQGLRIETAFNFMHFHIYRDMTRASGMQVESYRGYEETDVPFLANFALDPVSLDVRLHLTWHTHELTKTQVERIGSHYARALALMAADPAQPHDAQSLLSAEEEADVLRTWQGPDVAWPEPATVVEQIEAQAAKHPEAIAVVAAATGATLTYAALDREANRVAWALHAAGVGPEARVGVWCERGLELLVALVGVLKAGALYVPLDPTYPAARLALMVTDARLQCVLSQDAMPPVPGGADVPRLTVTVGADHPTDVAVNDAANRAADGATDGAAGGPASGARRGRHAAQGVSLLYTSGSTGRPKGVVTTQAGLANRLRWMQAAYGLTPADRVLQKTPVSFDVAGWELFWPLTAGAQLVLLPPGVAGSAVVATTLRTAGVTVCHFVPSMLRLLVAEAATEARGAPLRLVVCSGEALTGADVASAAALWPGVAVENLYGPTEASIDVTRAAGEAGPGPVPLGRPISNTQVYVCDDAGQATAVGVPGELYLGGVGLAREYWGQPAATAARFVPDPWGTGARLYRTGDRGWWRADGLLMYGGRRDGQVKLRGVRIELGEVEAVVGAHAAVAACVARVWRDQLVAYVVPRVEGELAEPALRAWARARLPEAMTPGRFVTLATLPRLPNGKVARDQLPAPDALAPAVHVEPRTPVEAVLAQIWAAVLHAPRVGATDQFFALGGHSLAATQVIARVRDALQVALPLREIFDHPRLEELAARIEQLRAEPDASTLALQADPAIDDRSDAAGNADDLEQLVGELERLSSGQVESLLDDLERTP